MIGSPSSEFITLCQSQVLLLTQALGAVSTVVYLAESTAESMTPTLVPLVAYPETVDLWDGLAEGLRSVSETDGDPVEGDPAVSEAIAQSNWPEWSVGYLRDSSTGSVRCQGSFLPAEVESSSAAVPPVQGLEAQGSYPLVLPLAHEGVVLGMLVSTRQLPPWTSKDYQQAEQVASTLAIACVMDQRSQWLQRQLNQRQLNQADQSETFHDLLHQFRNPLTALQTFGKLMVKRLPVEDTNRSIAEGIVRESRRLQDLAEHFDAAVAEGDDSLSQPNVPPTGGLLLPGGQEDANEIANSPTQSQPPPPTVPLAIEPSQGHGLGRSLHVQLGSIAEVALPLVQSTQPLAQERRLHLVHHIPSSLPDVWLDAAALGEVLHNLLDNALKYAPTGALVWVTAGLVKQCEGRAFQGIAVGDTGSGIPPDDQPQLFSRYFRGVQAQGDIPGTGLGLAIVRDLVQGMGGHIDLVSPVQGTPWLPLEAATYPQNPGTLFVVWLRDAGGASAEAFDFGANG